MGWFWSGKCSSKNRLDGKTAVITGSNTGIGRITALDFVKRGCHVVIACRSIERGKEAEAWIKEQCQQLNDTGSTVVMELNLASLTSVRKFANQFIDNYPNLHLLINNAGVMLCPHFLTEDGFEGHLATNHLGHFLLTMLLLPVIIKSAPARIVNVSSKAHITATSLNLDDINLEKSYSAVKAYGRSKLANILFTKELAKRLMDSGVNVYSLHPGVINTELTRHVDNAFFPGMRKFYHLFNFLMKTPEQGAQTTIYCAVDDAVALQTGLYYDDCKAVTPSSYARNDELALQLWNKSIEMVKLENVDAIFENIKS